MAFPPLSAAAATWSALRSRPSEALTILGLICLFCIVIAGTFDLKFAAGLFPRIVGCFGLLVTGIVAARFFAFSHAEIDSDDEMSAAPRDRRLIALTTPLAYGALFYVFGFYISAGAIIAGVPWLLGYRKFLALLVLTLATVGALHGVFSTLLDVPIPLGIVGEWFMRRFVYID